MRQLFSLIFLLTTLYTFSQTDTLVDKNEFAIFGGLGIGGNGIKQGFARGISASFHSGFHTIDGYLSRTTESEADYSYYSGKDLWRTYNAFNYALTYGYGLYKENYSLAAVVGIGHTNTTMRIKNNDFNSAPFSAFLDKNYIRTCGVIGLKATTRREYVGLSIKGYYNIFDGPSNYTILLGLEIICH
jgi:hypothetical protein